MAKVSNRAQNRAKAAKNDEFYTMLKDVEDELRHYKQHFRGKTVLCNCDDPRASAFFKYFTLRFRHLHLSRLIATCYQSRQPYLFTTRNSATAVYQVFDGHFTVNNTPDLRRSRVLPLTGDGSFSSPECLRFMDEADIVVTNPPFSKFREFIDLLMKKEKRFLVMGNMNAVTYRSIFSFIKQGRMWIGHHNGPKKFGTPSGSVVSMGNVWWYTNLPLKKRGVPLVLFQKYNPTNYPRYDNYRAIEVGRVVDIPVNYKGVMGVPISFLDKHCPSQFDILGYSKEGKGLPPSILCPSWGGTFTAPYIRGDEKYPRIFIRRK